MFTVTLKHWIKSHAATYKICRPFVTWMRRIKRLVFGHPADRFRAYCLKISKLAPHPVFVKVGAHDGMTGDPCGDLLVKNDERNAWRGVLIEPVPYCIQRLEENYSDEKRFIIEQVAIGSTPGRRKFYYVDQRASDRMPNLPQWFDQLGSFDRSHITKHLAGALESYIIETEVEVTTLSRVFERNGIKECHLLHIDAEGHDLEVLNSLDLSKTVPAMILMEHKHLNISDKKQALNLLRRSGYLSSDCGADYFAIHRDWLARCSEA